MGFYLNEYLTAKGVSLRKRVSDLFDELERNPELAQVFIRNPTIVLQSKLLPEFAVLDEEIIDSANQLLYSVLSNDKFMEWMEKYGTELIDEYNRTGEIPDKKKMLWNFAKGIIEFGDPKILNNLLEINQHCNTSVLERRAPVWITDHIVVLTEFFYIFIFHYFVNAPDKINILDENQKIVTISPKELKSLAEKIVKYARSVTAQTEEKKFEK